MKAVIQRVRYADLFIDGSLYSQINGGVFALIGISQGDTLTQADKLIHKIIHFRIFPNAQEKMQLSLLDVRGDLLLVPQFTLVAATEKGLKPSFSKAMPPMQAEPIFTYMIEEARRQCKERSKGMKISNGKFRTTMYISSVNEGPVTFILTS